MNKVILTGNLTKDIELTQVKDLIIGKFTLGVQKQTKNKDGNYDTDFLNCVVFNPGEYIQNNSLKGVKVLVEGRIQTKQYEKEGKNHYSTDIIVERIEILKKTQSTPQNENKGVNNPYQEFGTQFEFGNHQVEVDNDSSLPF